MEFRYHNIPEIFPFGRFRIAKEVLMLSRNVEFWI